MSCYSTTDGSKCDMCDFRYICRMSDYVETSDKPDDECENCPCDNKSGPLYFKKRYKIGPYWFTK